MRTLTKAEAVGMVRNHDRILPGPEEVWFGTQPCLTRSAATARLFAGLLGPGPVLWWVTEFGIWPSSENHYLFSALRLAEGEARPLHDAPGHVFDRGETEVLVSYLQMALLSGWGGIAVALEGAGRFILSHDEWAMLRVPEGAAPLGEVMAQYKLPFEKAPMAVGAFAALGMREDGTLIPAREGPEPS